MVPVKPVMKRPSTGCESKSWSCTLSTTSSARRSPRRAVSSATAGFTAKKSYAQLLSDQLERFAVAVGPLAVDLAGDLLEPLEDGVAAPFLALGDVGDVHLHRRDAGKTQGIPGSPTESGPGTSGAQ